MDGTALVRTGLVGLVAVAAACGNAGRDPQNDLPPGVEQPEIPPVSMVDNSFTPAMLQVPAAQQAVVEVSNDGQNPHSFTIDAIDVDTGVLQPGRAPR